MKLSYQDPNHDMKGSLNLIYASNTFDEHNEHKCKKCSILKYILLRDTREAEL